MKAASKSKSMNLYRVEAVYNGAYLLTAVVACETSGESFALAGFDGEDYSEREAVFIGKSIYSYRVLICSESL